MLSIRPSPIHGSGLFTDTFIPEGRLILVAGHQMTGTWVQHQPSQYINHHRTHNAVLYEVPGFLLVMASKAVPPNEEIVVNYDKPGWVQSVHIDGSKPWYV
jgi:hypothetical protein